MRLTQPATVLARLGEQVLVQVNGRDMLAENRVVPDLRPGDYVLIGAGCVIERLTGAEVERLRAGLPTPRASGG